MMYADKIIELLKSTPGLSDRQITDALFGPGKPQQLVNQLCRTLEKRGVIARRKGANAILGNFIVSGNPGCSSPKLGTAQEIADFSIPPDLSQKARELGRLWAESEQRPKLTLEMKQHWDALIDEWVSRFEMPLAVRKMGAARGTAVIHQVTGREIIITDNAPAQWAFSCALRGFQYSIDDLRSQISNNKIPFAFATKQSEKAQMKYTATLASCGVDLNRRGWKLCHIDPVGIKAKTITNVSSDLLETHFKRLLKPSNHFLVPKHWSGLGEIPEVIEEIRMYESCH